jgi:hypothetical protein
MPSSICQRRIVRVLFAGGVALLLAHALWQSPSSAKADDQVREYIHIGSRVVATVDDAVTPTATPTVPPPTPTPTAPPPPQGSALFIVGASGSAMAPEDAAVRDRLMGLGYTVTSMTGGTATTLDANGRAIVIISNTADAGTTGSKYKGVAVPVLVAKAGLYDDMSMTKAASGVDYGTVDGQSELILAASGGALTSGLSGTLLVASPSRFGWGGPAPAAIIAAWLADGTNRPAIFAYEANSLMRFNYYAPARRVGFFTSDGVAVGLNVYGWALFDSAVNWLAGS